MKVKIGPYISFIGPYQIADCLQKIGFSEETCQKIGDYISSSDWFVKVCHWIHKKRQRTIKVVIHNCDIWNLDCTLALIILPALKMFREDEGRFFVDNNDVPDELKSDLSPYEIPCELITKRANYVIDEMIYAFEQKNKDEDHVAKFNMTIYRKEQARIANGFRLFGRYYEGLWT